MFQCARTSASSRPASAWAAERLVIPYTTSTVALAPAVRSRTSSKPCLSPDHFWCAVRIEVVRSVRFSTRPCPLSTVVATRPAGGGGSASPGGSGRRDGSGGLLEAESGPDVGL